MLEKLFGFDPAKHNIKTEVMAGITTFLTMAYILAVNPSIFSVLASKGMVTNAVFTSTALAAIIGTLMMAIYAKKPFGLAPGMGLNAFFVFTVCLTMGYSWKFALTAILIEGLIYRTEECGHHSGELRHFRHHRRPASRFGIARVDRHSAHVGAHCQTRAGRIAHRNTRHIADRNPDGNNEIPGNNGHSAVYRTHLLPV